MTCEIKYLFRKHIVQPDYEIKDDVERAHYTPLIIGDLQKLMKERVISLQEKMTKKSRKVIQEEFDLVGQIDMYTFTCSLITFMEALLEERFHEKYCKVLFDGLIGQLEAIEKKIKE
ncbi:MAG: hypothetical protein ACO3YV_04505 [Pelagibacteraceae bacterium]